MRILLLFEFGVLNGGENSMLAVAGCLVRRQVAEFIFAAPAGSPLAREGIRQGGIAVPFSVRQPEGSRIGPGQIARDVAALVEQWSPDLVHANSLSMGRMLASAADDEISDRQFSKVPRTAHLRDISRLSARAVLGLNSLSGLIAVSRATADYHVQQEVDPRRVRVIHNGIDVEASTEFAAGTSREMARASLHAELGLSSNSVLALTIGQISLRKGQDVLLAAAENLASQFPRLHFLIVGERHSSKEETVTFEAELRHRAGSGALAGRVHFLGRREDVPRLMRGADLLIHPARQEPLGRVLLEAAASLLPIVATDVGGTREIVEDGISALLVPPNDPARLALALALLLEKPGLQHRLARAARLQIETNFSLTQSAAEHLAFWQHHAGRESSDDPREA